MCRRTHVLKKGLHLVSGAAIPSQMIVPNMRHPIPNDSYSRSGRSRDTVLLTMTVKGTEEVRV